MSSPRQPPSSEGRRIVICDYNALLISVTGFLRMNGYCVFQAYDAHAVEELCAELPNIELVVLNTFGTGSIPANSCGTSVPPPRVTRPAYRRIHTREFALRCANVARDVQPGHSVVHRECAHGHGERHPFNELRPFPTQWTGLPPSPFEARVSPASVPI
jgi:hypothetical protein